MGACWNSRDGDVWGGKKRKGESFYFGFDSQITMSERIALLCPKNEEGRTANSNNCFSDLHKMLVKLAKKTFFIFAETRAATTIKSGRYIRSSINLF